MSACVLDTDVVIAALDRSDAHHGAAAALITSALNDDIDLLVSTVNYAEALVRPAEEKRALRDAVDAIAALAIRTVPPTEKVARDAACFRGLGISLADGFALATARARSATVASFDKKVRRAMVEAGLEGPRSSLR